MDRAELKTGDWVVIRYKIDGIPYIKKLEQGDIDNDSFDIIRKANQREILFTEQLNEPL